MLPKILIKKIIRILTQLLKKLLEDNFFSSALFIYLCKMHRELVNNVVYCVAAVRVFNLQNIAKALENTDDKRACA